jgi:hypothetical protein
VYTYHKQVVQNILEYEPNISMYQYNMSYGEKNKNNVDALNVGNIMSPYFYTPND